jgi:aminoglycoside 3-N-acetyltransferase
MTLKQFASYIIYFLPNFISTPLLKYYRKRQLKTIRKRYVRTKVSKDDIVSVLDRFHLDNDVFLHSSLTSIGKIDMDIKAVTGLLLDKVDINKNTLLVSALPYRGRFKDYLEKGYIFNVKTARVEMGAINQYLSIYPNAIRSLHPTHSVVAIGPKADYYTAEHHLDITPCGIHSPYYKLIVSNAKILMFGANLRNLTFVHVISDMLGKYFPVNEYLKKIYMVKVIDYSGNSHTVKTLCHDPFTAIKRDTLRLLPYFIRYNAIDRHTIGESEILLLDVKKVTYSCFMALLDGVSNFGKFNLNNETEEKILEQIEFLSLA